jgi:hypothetical protein
MKEGAEVPQPKIYKNSAERQAAYRQRKGVRTATQSELANLARNLHYTIEAAIVYNEFPLPTELSGCRPEHTLRNLIRYLDPIYDPVRNPNGKYERQRWGLEEMKEEQTN